MIHLEPCPFCGQELEQRNSKRNPYARCVTPDCAGGKLPMISLDLPEDIERWNRRGREQAVARVRRDWAKEDKAAIERRDLLKQAEALDRCAEKVAAFSQRATPRGIGIAIRMEADELRRQAEGLKP